MHILDGYLKPEVWAAFDLISVPAAGYLSTKMKRADHDSRIPLLGVMGAFVFAAQMINFPIGFGTTGHLLGSTLLAVTLGPVAAALVLAVILGIQALVFQDGGLLAWGANTFNMAFCGVAAGYLPYYLVGHGRLRSISVFVGGVLSVMTGASLALLMLKISGSPVTPAVFGGSAVVFLITGLLEGAITVTVFEAIERLNPSLVETNKHNLRVTKRLFLGLSIALALVGISFASPLPDMLQKAIETMGIPGRQTHLVQSPLAGYELPDITNLYLRKAVAGLIGIGLVYAACLLLSRSVRPRRQGAL